MGVTDFEYGEMVKFLGRTPTYPELGMFAVMWSEHCGYKYSRPVLAYFAKYKEAMEGAGLENAGIVPIGDGWGVTMKVESHNHPSAVEPYQGAATGVGGIIRDILTMGARPIAMLNALRFGPLSPTPGVDAKVIERNRYLFEHVVAGIAGYGNCVGVPTVAGEVNFDARYSGNPLVNAMCVGLIKLDEVTTAAASGVGNSVIYLGSATGKDGIHGATFASDTLGEDSDDKRPNVQFGDPFAEKLLIEATLEALQTGAIVAIQDMGAAGLTCSTVEMAAKGRVGMDVDLDLVPMRESTMTAYELLLSESQERMLAIVTRGREEEVLSVFRKWGLPAAVIGQITDGDELVIRRHGTEVVRVTPRWLADECPVYHMRPEEPAYYAAQASWDPATVRSQDPQADLLQLLAHPTVASKAWVFRQFDQEVQTQTVAGFGESDAAVLRIRQTGTGIAVKIDGNALTTYLDPYQGGLAAVAEANRNVALTGARPQALTDGLNFGSPQQPHVFWQFERAVRGIADAAEAFSTPVVSGNVSFYNQSELGEVLPTPLIGSVGVLDDPSRVARTGVVTPGALIRIAPSSPISRQGGLGGSLFASLRAGEPVGRPEAVDLEHERRLQSCLPALVAEGLVVAAHDAAEGGAAVALAEMVVSGTLGLAATLPGEDVTSVLFGERPGVVFLVTADPEEVLQRTMAAGLSAEQIGSTTDTPELRLKIRDVSYVWSTPDLRGTYSASIPVLMERDVRASASL